MTPSTCARSAEIKSVSSGDAAEGRTDHFGRHHEESQLRPGRGAINDRIDDANCAKYSRSKDLEPIIGRRARSATFKVMPRK